MDSVLHDLRYAGRGLRRSPGFALSAVPSLWGIGTGVLGAGVITNALSAGLVGVQPLDPATFGSAALLLLTSAAAAGYVPARRAAHVDPVVTLRSE